MFEELIPDGVLDTLESEFHLKVYSAMSRNAKGGRVSVLGAFLPHGGVTEDNFLEFRAQVKESLKKLGYKTRIVYFWREDLVDTNDFRIEVLHLRGRCPPPQRS